MHAPSLCLHCPHGRHPLKAPPRACPLRTLRRAPLRCAGGQVRDAAGPRRARFLLRRQATPLARRSGPDVPPPPHRLCVRAGGAGRARRAHAAAPFQGGLPQGEAGCRQRSRRGAGSAAGGVPAAQQAGCRQRSRRRWCRWGVGVMVAALVLVVRQAAPVPAGRGGGGGGGSGGCARAWGNPGGMCIGNREEVGTEQRRRK
jgi:hypothetical protein